MKAKIEYTLYQPVRYAYKGEEVETLFIELRAPTSRHMTECAFLKQAFFRSLPESPTDASEISEQEAEQARTALDSLDGDAVIHIITVSKNVDLAPVLATGRELLIKNVAFIDGETRLTKPIIDKMLPADLESMVGEYIANFILPSALQRQKKN